MNVLISSVFNTITLAFRKKYPSNSSVVEVIVEDGKKPYGIALDMKSDHLYWIDISFHTLFRSDLNGSNRREILGDLTGAITIALDTVNK